MATLTFGSNDNIINSNIQAGTLSITKSGLFTNYEPGDEEDHCFVLRNDIGEKIFTCSQYGRPCLAYNGLIVTRIVLPAFSVPKKSTTSSSDNIYRYDTTISLSSLNSNIIDVTNWYPICTGGIYNSHNAACRITEAYIRSGSTPGTVRILFYFTNETTSAVSYAAGDATMQIVWAHGGISKNYSANIPTGAGTTVM